VTPRVISCVLFTRCSLSWSQSLRAISLESYFCRRGPQREAIRDAEYGLQNKAYQLSKYLENGRFLPSDVSLFRGASPPFFNGLDFSVKSCLLGIYTLGKFWHFERAWFLFQGLRDQDEEGVVGNFVYIHFCSVSGSHTQLELRLLLTAMSPRFLDLRLIKCRARIAMLSARFSRTSCQKKWARSLMKLEVGVNTAVVY
jgi:hypothetical protein